MEVAVVDNANDVEMIFDNFRRGLIDANPEPEMEMPGQEVPETEVPGQEVPETEIPGQEVPESEIPVPVRPDPNRTLVIDGNIVPIDDIEFVIDGNVIPINDVDLSFDDANENPTIVSFSSCQQNLIKAF